MVKLLIFENEPNPYKIDMWNYFGEQIQIKPYVIFTIKKNWQKDGGHNYNIFPEIKFNFRVFNGKGFFDKIKSIISTLLIIKKEKPTLIYFCGYDNFIKIFFLAYFILTKKKILFFFDVFNNKKPINDFFSIKYTCRQICRKIIKKHTFLFLTCGVMGRNSGLKENIPDNKIVDFPYTVDRQRLLNNFQTPKNYSYDKSKIIFLFSGRMIERKGLDLVLNSFSKLPYKNWILWIEGDGLLFESYIEMAKKLKIFNQIKFWGFCQMGLHNWLLNNSNVVLIPSIYDPWGIVVDEALQLGKVVVSTYSTGSALDRIKDNENGFLFDAKNSIELNHKLIFIFENYQQLGYIKLSAESQSFKYSPKYNYENLLSKISY